MFARLRSRFTILIIALAIVPQILAGIILASQAYSSLEGESLKLQQEVAQSVGQQIERFFINAERELILMDDVLGLGTLDRESQRNALNSLLINQRIYQELILLDKAGREQIYLSRSVVVLEPQLQHRYSEEEYLFPMREESTYFGPVQFDPNIREPLAKIAVPILERRSGEVSLILIASVRLKSIWDLLADLDLPQQRQVFVIDVNSRVIAHRLPTIVLRDTQFELPAQDGRAPGLSGQESIVGSYALRIGQQDLIVIAEQPLNAALAVATSGLEVTLAVMLISLVAGMGLVFLAIRQIVLPIEALAESARAISAGDLTRQARLIRDDEIGDLALAFNSMTRQLGTMIATLEQRVADRTQELEEALTEQKYLITMLESKNEELERFTYTISHDLRSPLITIKGFLGYIDQDIRLGNLERVDEDLNRISHATSKMHEMLDELLEISRIGRVASTPEWIEMGDLVAEAVESVAGRLDERGITVAIGPALPVVFGERIRLRELLENLIDNAAKFSGDQAEPTIEIGAEDGDGETIFYVKDNGVGIEPQFLELVFNMFEQLDQRIDGSGMGLAIARRIVETHEGRIWVKSEGLGQGSCFYFSLPKHIELSQERSKL
jgi:signal transduction histidine kinase